MMNRSLILVIVLLAFIIPVKAQISSGGIPRNIPQLKSGKTESIKMPKVDNKVLLAASIKSFQNSKTIKPFEFAKGFHVNITPENSGNWFVLDDGTQVWQVQIKSENAESVNIIFHEFFLPEKARLFLFNQNKDFILGAFTSFNNKESGKFAVLPVPGDEIIIQYEIPADFKRRVDFRIEQVNHDYYGILKYNDRRPLDKVAGSCNIDVNCEMGEDWVDVKDAVCRMIVDGREICTGTLINNAEQDEKPYIISASHCYDKWEYAETTLYTFNYESPFCQPLDGDPLHTVSGAVMRAQFDSLDFALAEMSLIPPPDFRPFFAGWDNSGNLPTNSVSIHHPQGDVKKISFDDDAAKFSDFNSDYMPNGFFEISRWDAGVTEAGSSGGPLFNPGKHVIGTLTGGLATCSNPIRDYFNRFDLAWDYHNNITKQLKHWLDPNNTGAQSIDGKRFYTQEDLCGAFTHLNDDDEHKKIVLRNNNQFAGYWGGTNTMGITEMVEKFSIYGNEQLQGISLGVAKVYDAPGGSDSEIKIKVYNGNRLPETLIHEKTVKIKNLASDAMNFIPLDEMVQPTETFFIGFELSNMQAQDSFIVYQSLRNPLLENFFYFKKSGQWYNFQENNPDYNSMANVFELVACNIDGNASDTPLVNNPAEIIIYPNPTSETITLESGDDMQLETVKVFNLLGKEISVILKNYTGKKVQINFAGNVPGVYFVQVKNGDQLLTRKISYVPW